MKVRILNDSGYGPMKVETTFPIDVEMDDKYNCSSLFGELQEDHANGKLISIPTALLGTLGWDVVGCEDLHLNFEIGTEVEILES